MSSVNNNIPFVPENTIDPAAGLNESINVIDALLQLRVLAVKQNAPPASPSAGDRYIVGSTPTGAWVGHALKLATWMPDGYWMFRTAWVAVHGTSMVINTGSDWVPATAGSVVVQWGEIAGSIADQVDLVAALGDKVDEVSGKGLSTEDYTTAEKSKLAGIAAGATANANTDSLAEGATRLYFTTARVLATVLSGLSLATGTAITSSDSVLVAFGKLQKQITDLITTVGGKQDALVSGTSIKTINGESVLGSGNIAISGAGADWGDIGGTLSDQTDLQAALNAKAALAGRPSRTITASGAVTPSDAGKWLLCDSATPITLTIGEEATASWAVSGVLPEFYVLQVGAGAVTVTGDGFSVTYNAADTNVLDGAGSAATLLRTGSNTWRMLGRMVAA